MIGLAACLGPSAAPAAAGGDAERPANLADLPLEELMEIEIPTVAAASRRAEKLTEAPASVTIVTADEIERYGYRTLADVLRSATGFYGSYDYSYDYVGSRGFLRPGDLNTRFLLLVDGHRVNDNVYGQALLGTEGVIDLALVERIEIVRGPASALYGSSAFFGTVSVVTRSGASVDGLDATVAARSGDTFEGALAYGRTFSSGADLLVSVSSTRSGGQRQYYPEFDAPETNYGVTEGTDDDAWQHLFAKFAWSGFTAEAVSSRREKGIPTAAWEMLFDDSRARTVDTWSHLALTQRSRLGANWEFEGKLGLDDYRYTGRYPGEGEPPVVNADETHGNSWGADLRVMTTAGRAHALTFGVEYRDDWRQDQSNFDEEPYALSYEKQGSDSVAALYIQDQVRLGERFRIDLGVRHDHYQSVGGTTNPRLALIFSPVPSVAVKALYGSAFRAPTAYELFFAPDRDTGNYESNQELRPETVTTGELVGEWYVNRQLRLVASLFRYDVEDLIRLGYDEESGQDTSDNVDRVTSEGAELELVYGGSDGTQAVVNYATADARDDQTDIRMTNSPRHLARARVSRPLFERRLTPALELQYESERTTLAGRSTGSRFLVNLSLTGRLAGRLAYGAGVTNLLDRHYGDPGAESHVQDTLPQRGGNYWFTLRWHFDAHEGPPRK